MAAASSRHHRVDDVVLVAPPGQLSSAVRRAFERDHRFRLVAEVHSGDELANHPGNADVVVVDALVPGLHATEAIECFRATHPDATIVALSPMDAPYLRYAMTAAGADGFLAVGTVHNVGGALIALICSMDDHRRPDTSPSASRTPTTNKNSVKSIPVATTS